MLKAGLGSPGTPKQKVKVKKMTATIQCLLHVNVFQVCFEALTWSEAFTSCWRLSVPPSFARSTVSSWGRYRCLPASSQHRSEEKNTHTPCSNISESPLTWTSASVLSVSAWIWRRDALCHHRLQFWSQRCRKAAGLQGTDETQSYRDTVTFSKRRWLVWPLHFVTGISGQNGQHWPFECPEPRSSRTLYVRRLCRRSWLPSCYWTSSQKNPGWSHEPPTVATFDAAVKGFCVFCHMDCNISLLSFKLLFGVCSL